MKVPALLTIVPVHKNQKERGSPPNRAVAQLALGGAGRTAASGGLSAVVRS
jgi:hypothetical protein